MSEPRSPASARRDVGWILAAAFLAILARSVIFLRYEQVYFDGDQAITGLMAKQFAEGRAWPVFYYGQHYMLAVEAWLAALVFKVAAPSVLTLRLPLVAINLAAVVCLIAALRDDERLVGWDLLVASAFFVCAPVIAASRLVEAQGGNIEPFVYVPLLWLTRRRPVLFGSVAAIGILNRQFTAYALVALAAVAFMDRRERPRLTALLASAGSFAAIWVIVAVLAQGADVLGPGTGADGESMSLGAVGAVTKRVGWHPSDVAQNVAWLFQENLPALFGAPRAPLGEFVTTNTSAPPFWIWWALLAAGGAIGLRVAQLALGGRRIPNVALFLMLVGAQSAIVYAVAGVDVRANVLVRYTLLALLFPTGLVAAHLAIEPKRIVANLTRAIVIGWIALSAVGHARLIHEYATHRPANPYRQIVEYLRARGVRYGIADYWTAYALDFLSNESLVISSREKVRVQEYQRLVEEHDAEAVQIWREPGFCERETRVGPWYVCGL